MNKKGAMEFEKLIAFIIIIIVIIALFFLIFRIYDFKDIFLKMFGG